MNTLYHSNNYIKNCGLILNVLLVVFLVTSPLITAAQATGAGNPLPNENTGVDTGTPLSATDSLLPPPAEVVIPPGQELKGLNYYMYGLMVTIGGIFTWFGGLMLDTSLQYFVIQMGDRLMKDNFGFTVDALWSIIRDTLNMLFIFMLIYIGIKTILYSDDTAVKKQLGYLIAAALLINFSLLITKTIIDFSNIAAVQIYNAIKVDGDGALATTYENITNTKAGESPEAVKSVSSVFMQHFNLQSYADADNVRLTGAFNNIISWKVFTFGLLMMLVMIIAGFAFLSGAILMIYRFVALIFFMIFSPLMFLGWIYPSFKKHSDKWWQKFLSNAFVAPAYMFMLYLSMKIVAGIPMNDANGGMYFGSAFENQGGSFAVFTYFFVMAGFLYGSTQVATLMGAAGAKATAHVGNIAKNGITNTAKSMTINPAQNFGKNLGALAYRKAPFLGGDRYQKSLKNLDEAQARIAADPGGGSTRDKALVAWHKARGFGDVEQRRRNLEEGANRKAFGGRSTADIHKDKEANASRSSKAASVLKIQADLATPGPNQFDSLHNATSQQVVEMAKTAEGMALLKTHVAHLSNDQIKAIQNSTDLEITDADKTLLATNHRTAKTEKLNTNLKQNTQTNEYEDIKNANKDQLKQLYGSPGGGAVLAQANNAVRLTDDQVKWLKELMTDGTIEPAEFAAIEAARNNGLNSIVNNVPIPNSSLNSNFFDKMKSPQIATLPANILAALANNNQLQLTDLEAIHSSGRRDIDKNLIRTLIIGNAGNPGTPPYVRVAKDWLENDPSGIKFG